MLPSPSEAQLMSSWPLQDLEIQAAGRQSPGYYWLPDTAQNFPFFVSLQLHTFVEKQTRNNPENQGKEKISQTCVQATSEQTRTRHERLCILPDLISCWPSKAIIFASATTPNPDSSSSSSSFPCLLILKTKPQSPSTKNNWIKVHQKPDSYKSQTRDRLAEEPNETWETPRIDGRRLPKEEEEEKLRRNSDGATSLQDPSLSPCSPLLHRDVSQGSNLRPLQ